MRVGTAAHRMLLSDIKDPVYVDSRVLLVQAPSVQLGVRAGAALAKSLVSVLERPLKGPARSLRHVARRERMRQRQPT